MKLLNFAAGTALALSLAAAGAAQAQAPAAAAKEAPQRQIKISGKASKAIVELDAAVKAKNYAAVPALVAAANAVAQTKDDRYAIATRQLSAAIDSNDYPGLVVAADAMTASGSTVAETGKIYLFAAQKLIAAKQLAPAEAALGKLIAVDLNNSDAMLLKSEVLFQQQKLPESVALLTQAIDRQKAVGAVPESWYQARVARAYNAKLPAVYDYSRQWVVASPTPAHWKDAINIYRNMSGLDRPALIDLMRLARVAKAISGESDYYAWGQSLLNRGNPSTALALLQEGAASGSITLAMPSIAPLVTLAKTRMVGDKASLATASKTALTAATAAPAMRAADGNLDAGDFAQAATLYRAALTKSGVDKDLANLRLGQALLQSGDKPGATAAFQAVGGTQAEIARYWMAYAQTRA